MRARRRKVPLIPTRRAPRNTLSSRWTAEIHDARDSTYTPQFSTRCYSRTVDRTRLRDERNLKAQPQRNLLKSILASHFSVDFNVSSHVTSRPVYAAVRAIMHESADSAPLSA